jgi:hypothetical protein
MKNYLTYSEIDSKCRKLAGVSENDIITPVRQAIINDLIYKIYGLLDGVNHPWWNRIISLTVGADQEELKDTVTNGGTITAIDSTAKTIARSSGTFPAGAILDIVVVTKSNDLIAGQWKARVTVAGATATYEKIGTGTEVTYASATHVCFVNVMKKLSATSADLSTQYVKDLIKVFDDQETGTKERVFDRIKDPRIFGNTHKDPFHTKRIAWYHGGDTIYFDIGATATAIGIAQAEIVACPTLYTDATENNTLDIPPAENQMLTDEVVSEFLKQSGNPVPSDLAARLTLYQKRYESSVADRLKALEIKGKTE